MRENLYETFKPHGCILSENESLIVDHVEAFRNSFNVGISIVNVPLQTFSIKIYC